MVNNTTAPPPPYPELASLVQTVEMAYLISGIYLSVIAVITIFGNGLLLLAIITDPFKSFRTPTTLFVVGLAVADFLTGAVVDPLTAFLTIASYLKLAPGSKMPTSAGPRFPAKAATPKSIDVA